jgi:hypothetical protein
MAAVLAYQHKAEAKSVFRTPLRTTKAVAFFLDRE